MSQTKQPKPANDKPQYVVDLEAAYGPPSDAAFGGAVFYEVMDADGDLETTAKEYYKQFLGKLWAKRGEYDTRTPPVHGRALAEQLANATLVMIPQSGHETWGVGNCAARIGIEFIRNPEQSPDLSCLDTRRHRFSLPGEVLE